jgi:DnaJ-class molecular chaperone
MGRSRRYHPDRSSDPRDEQIFIVLRRAYETLSDPTKRFAFDRFGPDILTWGLEGTRPDSRMGGKKEVGIRDFLIAGLMRSVGFYVFSGGIMAVLAGESVLSRENVTDV